MSGEATTNHGAGIWVPPSPILPTAGVVSRCTCARGRQAGTDRIGARIPAISTGLCSCQAFKQGHFRQLAAARSGTHQSCLNGT